MTHTGCIAAGVSNVFSRDCLSVCPHSKSKTALTVNSKLGTHILYCSRSAGIDPKVKDQGHTVTKTVTVARLLVTRAATAVCCCCRRGSACRYDCLCFLVINIGWCHDISHSNVATGLWCGGIWNLLLMSVRNTNSRKQFKIHLKTWLFESAYM